MCSTHVSENTKKNIELNVLAMGNNLFSPFARNSFQFSKYVLASAGNSGYSW